MSPSRRAPISQRLAELGRDADKRLADKSLSPADRSRIEKRLFTAACLAYEYQHEQLGDSLLRKAYGGIEVPASPQEPIQQVEADTPDDL